MFSCPIQIRMSDLDPYNHVNNGAQCNYFDMGRSRYFEHVFQTKIDWLTFKCPRGLRLQKTRVVPRPDCL